MVIFIEILCVDDYAGLSINLCIMKKKAATGVIPATAKPFLPNPYLDYFDKLEFTLINIFQTLYDYQSGIPWKNRTNQII